MSANANPCGPTRRVLMVVANPSTSTTLGKPVGLWASELTHAWYELHEAGYETVIASPDGGAVALDAASDPRDASGYSKDDLISLGFLSRPDLAGLLSDTPAISRFEPADFDALYIAGGQSPMFTFRRHEGLKALVRRFWEAGKLVAAVCHGTAALLDVELSDGSFLVAGRHMTGFANSEEDFVDALYQTKVMPFRIEDEARARGAHFVTAPAFRAHAVRDGRLVTGQQQYSGRAAAERIIEALGR